MRQALALMIGCVFAFAASAQTITIKVNGNKNKQLLVDGRTYTVDPDANGQQRSITISELAPGQHSLQLVRNNRRTSTTTNFTTRNGYETLVTIAANGSVHVKEKQLSTASTVRTPMSDADFSRLLQRTRNHVRNSSRLNAVQVAISNADNYFTTAQLRLLLESFEGETKRLELAKQAYPRVTDQVNFGTLNTVFDQTANRDALTAFIRSQGGDLSYSYSESFRTPMLASNFTSILESVETQWQEGARLSTIIDVFDNTNYYFSTDQAIQLIRLVGDESSRLHLAKAAYSRITDLENFSRIYALFTQPAYINSLAAYVSANGNTMEPSHNMGKTAMSETEFSAVYNRSRNHFRNSSIYREVSTALSNPAYYFSSYQVRQLLSLVKGEGERLQLAKAAYRGVTDSKNFMTQMNDLFTLQSSRDELQNYINSYVNP